MGNASQPEDSYMLPKVIHVCSGKKCKKRFSEKAYRLLHTATEPESGYKTDPKICNLCGGTEFHTESGETPYIGPPRVWEGQRELPATA